MLENAWETLKNKGYWGQTPPNTADVKKSVSQPPEAFVAVPEFIFLKNGFYLTKTVCAKCFKCQICVSQRFLTNLGFLSYFF